LITESLESLPRDIKTVRLKTPKPKAPPAKGKGKPGERQEPGNGKQGGVLETATK